MLIAYNVPTYNLFFALQQEDNFDFKNDDANRIKELNDNFINFTKKRVTGHWNTNNQGYVVIITEIIPCSIKSFNIVNPFGCKTRQFISSGHESKHWKVYISNIDCLLHV